MKFIPCTGQCTEDGSHCEGCGRSHEEIAQMRSHIGGLVRLAKEQDYDNVVEFAEAVAKTIKAKLA